MSGGGLPAPSPDVTPETRPFWEATAEGRLLIGHCDECDRFHFYPRSVCPHCFAAETDMVEASGRGTVYTCTVTRQVRGPFADAVPYVLAYVELEEGPRVMTNVVGVSVEAVEVGQPVEVVFAGTAGSYRLPRFTPV